MVRLLSQTRKGRWGGGAEVQTFRPKSALMLDTDLVGGKEGQEGVRGLLSALGVYLHLVGCLLSRSVVSHSCDRTDLPGSFVYGISKARILEWIAISSSRRSS